MQFENELITKLDQEVEGGRGDEQYKVLLEKTYVRRADQTQNISFILKVAEVLQHTDEKSISSVWEGIRIGLLLKYYKGLYDCVFEEVLKEPEGQYGLFEL